MGALNDWTVIDANNNATPPDGWPENTMQYSEVNNTGRAVQGTLRRFFGDINGSLQAGGVADAYTLTLNETGYIAYFAGMYFACEIMATNTGASTIDVNGIGVQSITDRAGGALTAGELQAGGIYEFRYDGTNFQLMGTVAGAVNVPSAVLTNTNDPDLVDTDVALNIGAVDPTAAQHIEIGPQNLQSKSDGTTAAAFRVNRLGGDVEIGAQGGSGRVVTYNDGVIMTRSAANNWSVLSSLTGDPTVPDGISVEIDIRSQDLNEYGSIGFGAPGIDLRILNRAHGGNVQLRAEDAAGVDQLLLDGDPDGILSLYYDGAIRALTRANGQLAVRSDGNTDTENRLIALEHQNGTDRAFLGFVGSGELVIRNLVDDANLVLQATDAVSALQTVFVGDPDGQAVMYSSGVAAVGTLANGGRVFDTAGDNPSFQMYQDDLVTRNFFITSMGAGVCTIRNEVDGENIRIEANDAVGSPQILFQGDPDGAATLYFDGAETARTGDGRMSIVGDATDSIVDFFSDNGLVQEAFIQMTHAGNFNFKNLVNGGLVNIRADNAGGTERDLIVADPDDDVALFDAGTEVARTLPAASGGFEANNTATGAGFERVLTTSDLTGAGFAFEGATAAKTSGTQNILTSTLTEPTLNFEEFDNGGWHSTATNSERMTTIAPYDRFHLWYSAGLSTLNDPGLYQWRFNGSLGNTWVGNVNANREKVGTVNQQMQEVLATLANDDNTYFTGQNFQNSGVTQSYLTSGSGRTTFSIQGFEV